MQEVNYFSQDILSIVIPPLVIFVGVVLILFVMHKKKGEIGSQKKALSEKPVATLTKKLSKKKESPKKVVSVTKTKKKILPEKSQMKQFFTSLFGESNPKKELMKDERTLQSSPVLSSLSFAEKKWKMRKMKIMDKEVGKSTPKEIEDEYEKMTAEGESIDLRKKTEIIKDKFLTPSDLYEGDETESSFIERIAVNPMDIEAYEQLGDLYIEHKSYIDAKECYKQVLRLQPVNKKARTRMRYIEKMLNR